MNGWWWLRLGAAGMVCAGLLLAVLAGSALVEREDGRGNALAERLEQFIRQNETLHYQVHMVTGRVLMLFPPTRGRGAEEYRKASFHAPEEVRQARALKAKLPGSEPQVDALVVCQGTVKAKLGAMGTGAVFPPIRTMTVEDLGRAVFDNGTGTLNVVQTVQARLHISPPPGAQGGAATVTATLTPQSELVYSCDAYRNAFGRWVVKDVAILR